jgi:hypothetical protein
MKSFKKALRGIAMSLLVLAFSYNSIAQKSDRVITTEEQKTILDKAFVLLKANYIFPNTVNVMEREIYKKLSTGAYAKFTSVEDFLKNINADLERSGNDRHIDIFYDPSRVKQIDAEAKNEDSKPVYDPRFLLRAKYENYMVRKAERLEGNVGYLKFNAFVDPELSKPTLTAAMNFISNSSALIIDLRQNGGGDSRTLSFLLNYFLPDSTLVSQRRSRMNKEIRNMYIEKDPAVKKIAKDVPVYILTSKRTSSAAEAFAYTLQAFKRGIVVGDTTNGEANPGYLFSLNKEMYMMIPAFESTNAVTKTNWQGKGVVPDIKLAADKAHLMAQAKAYEQLATTTGVAENKIMYEWMATGLLAEVAPFSVSENDLKLFAGNYADNLQISFADGKLFHERTSGTNGKRKMIPIKENLFGVEGYPFFRVHFVKNARGQVTALQGLYDDGKNDESKKL